MEIDNLLGAWRSTLYKITWSNWSLSKSGLSVNNIKNYLLNYGCTIKNIENKEILFTSLKSLGEIEESIRKSLKIKIKVTTLLDNW